ncbi:carbohydrate kinase family protein [Arthrobacter sp. 35W]|uniref:carbohydrate kinase family protein n=1 Tax=Arthrobacter sp. 35W TaxID=1132441 RepID=UPI0003F77468|nr:carbohydrate kinase [Arthrobacter sp. 35W]
MLTVIGEALIDEVVHPGAQPVPHVGGSPLNVAVGLARLGHPVQFLGRYGQDAYGVLVSSHLHDNHVLVPLAPDAKPTSVARAVLDGDGAASYEFALDWELPALAADAGAASGTAGAAGSATAARPHFMLASSTLVHTGSIAAMLAPGADQVLAAVRAAHPHATISYDPNARPSIITDVDYAREQAEKFVRLADVVKASDEDLAWLYPGVDPLDSARRWLDINGAPSAGSSRPGTVRDTGRAGGPAVVVVTRGSGGPWAVCAAGEVQCQVPATEVVDTVGAGDSFMAALLSAVVDRELDGAQRREELRAISAEELGTVLRYAARAAAITVSRAGANPPSRTELHTAPTS